MREANDIDYLLDDNYSIVKVYENIESHDEVLKHYKKEKIDLMYNPKYFFYYQGFKFISFDSLYLMKKIEMKKKIEMILK
ncbi:hypothetical protein [Francisella salimarina]|uniref:hypothetical protein n=1 Tax=Francisella salimarina TaxID=2599927 RepID=UPI003D8139F8